MAMSYEIGLSGLEAARRALDTIGNNVANATTEGYHRQRLELTPARQNQFGPFSYGTGVEVAGITRIMDRLLEAEILLQTSTSEAVNQELSALQTIETAFGEFGGADALNTYINQFFESLRDLAAHPNELTWQYQLVSAAEVMAGQFRTLGTSLADLDNRALREAQALATQVNELSAEIAVLNASIEKIEIGGTPSNNLRDQRDHKITEMAALINVDTIEREHGVVDVSAGGIPVVLNSRVTDIAVDLVTSNTMGIHAVESANSRTSQVEGQIGGLMHFKNTQLVDIIAEFNALAKGIADQINQYHVQGLGSNGSFTRLEGSYFGAATDVLSDLDPDITAGTIFVRVTDTTTGNVSRHAIAVGDPASTTLGAVAADLDALTGLSASVVNDRLTLIAQGGYTFDFIPAPLSAPETTDFTGATAPPTVSVSGHYTGTGNPNLTFTVSHPGPGTGQVGNSGNLTLTVNDGTSDIKVFNIGTGYVAGHELDLDNGLKVRLSLGDLADTNSFTVQALSNTDTTGLLAAAGINTFFEGSDALGLDVAARIKTDRTLVATALGSDVSDNHNISRMADLVDTTLAALDNQTISGYYQTMVTTLGQDISILNSREENLEAVLQGLGTRRTEISGVDINEEAARILMFEQMFQAMAKYMNTINDNMKLLMDSM
jgi:flagellar hook-associated protein FlgK